MSSRAVCSKNLPYTRVVKGAKANKKERLGPVAFCDKGNIYKWGIGRGNYLNRRLRLSNRRTCIFMLQIMCFISKETGICENDSKSSLSLFDIRLSVTSRQHDRSEHNGISIDNIFPFCMRMYYA